MSRGADRVVIEPLERALLDGVPDGSGGRRAVDVAILTVFSDERPLQGVAGLLDWRSSGRLSQLVRSELCTGGRGEAVLLPARLNLPVRRLVVLGLGESEAFDSARASEIGARIVEVARDLRPADVLVGLSGLLTERRIIEAAVEALARRVEPGGEPAGADASGGVASEPVAPTGEGTLATESDPAGTAGTHPRTWWVIVDARLVSRLRRVIEGPPRPADPS